MILMFLVCMNMIIIILGLQILIITIPLEIIHVRSVHSSSHHVHSWHSSHTRHASHASHTRHSSHASHSTHSSKTSHISHHLFQVSATSLFIRIILILPLLEVNLEPVLLGFVLQQPLPVRSVLCLLQSKLDTSWPHLVLCLLWVYLLQQLHVQLINFLVHSCRAFEIQRILFNLNIWFLNIRNINRDKNNLGSLGPGDTRC